MEGNDVLTVFLAMAEGLALESFLSSVVKLRGTAKEMIDQYGRKYNVPPAVVEKMHLIRENRNKVAHSLNRSWKKIDYLSSDMKSYQSYYYASLQKPQKTKEFSVDVVQNSATPQKQDKNEPVTVRRKFFY